MSDILPYVKEDFIEMLKFCSAGPLKMLRIKPESTLYNLSTELPRPLPEKKIWLFLDRKDINKKVLDFYRREMDYNFLTNWTVKKDLNLIQMSDIQTVLRLFCDERVNVNLKQYIAYAFGIKKKQGLLNLRRWSHYQIDHDLLKLLCKAGLDVDGFIYLETPAGAHHTEIALCDRTKIKLEKTTKIEKVIEKTNRDLLHLSVQSLPLDAQTDVLTLFQEPYGSRQLNPATISALKKLSEKDQLNIREILSSK